MLYNKDVVKSFKTHQLGNKEKSAEDLKLSNIFPCY